MQDPRTQTPPPPLIESCGVTNTGRARDGNEDQFLVADLVPTVRISASSLPAARASGETAKFD